MIGVVTGATCGLMCWMAQEDVCHCSCGGVNHGCLRTEGRVQPIREARVDGVRCELRAVGELRELEAQAKEMNLASGIKTSFGSLLGNYYSAATSREATFRCLPAKVRLTSKQQVAAWPELTAWRGTRRPYLLWVAKETK